MFQQQYSINQSKIELSQFNQYTPFYLFTPNYSNNFNFNNQYGVFNQQQPPYLVCQNNIQYYLPQQSNMEKLYQYQQITQQQPLCFAFEESAKLNTNNYQITKEKSDSLEILMDIEQTILNSNEEPLPTSLLNYEISRNTSQSLCSWKSKPSITDDGDNNIQIIQSIAKNIIKTKDTRVACCPFDKEYQTSDKKYYSKKLLINNFPPTNYIEDYQNLSQYQDQVSSKYLDEKQLIQKNINKNQKNLNKQFDSIEQAIINTSKRESEQIDNEKKMLFFNKLKNTLYKQYDLQDEKQLINKIQEELTFKCYQLNKKSEQLFENPQSEQKQIIEDQHKTFLQCLFLNLSSDVNKKFCNDYQQVNVNDQPLLLQNNSQKNQITLKINNQGEKNIDFEKSTDNKQFNHPNCLNKSQSKFQSQICSPYLLFEHIKPKSISFLKNFDFSDIKLNYQKKKQQTKEKKQNSSYQKNSIFHNLNKLFMYNILSMYRQDSLNNLDLPLIIIQELNKIILKLKISSRRDYKNATRGFFDYFSHSHYKVLFLKVNNNNIKQIRENKQDVDLHLQCFNIDLAQEINEIELSYMNLIKEINFRIFSINIQEKQILDDGTLTKQNVRRKYVLKVVKGIKKLVKGIVTKKF